VRDAGDERRLRPDDDEVDGELAREAEEALRILRVHRVAVPDARDAGVAGGAVELRPVLREPPRQCVFPPARPHEEHLHEGRFADVPAAQESPMSEPGLDLHQWRTRWEQLDEVAHESPADAAGEMDRLLEEMLAERQFAEEDEELRRQFDASRELYRSYERGDGDAGELAEAINGYRLLYETLTTTFEAP